MSRNVPMEFHWACRTGDLEKVTNLLSQNTEINVKALNEVGTLHNAVNEKFTEIVKVLLKIGVNVNGLDCFGNTPLNRAVGYKANLRIVQILLENGANIDARDSQDKTALYTACNFENYEIVQELLKHNPKIDPKAAHDLSPLQIAAYRGSVKTVEVLLKHGANINHLDFNKRSTLNFGINGGDSLIVKTLLDNGCKTNVSNTRDGLTEIEVALKKGFKDIMKMLALHEI